VRRASGKNCRDRPGAEALPGRAGDFGGLRCFISLIAKMLGKRLAHWHALCLNGLRMLDPIYQSGNFQLAQKLLDGAALRQEAIAANIANSETPGYRRVDLAPDFAEHLKSSFQAGDREAIADMVAPKLTEDSAARSTGPNGNTVDLTSELLAMDKNSVDYSYLTEVVSQNIKQLRIAITGTPA